MKFRTAMDPQTVRAGAKVASATGAELAAIGSELPALRLPDGVRPEVAAELASIGAAITQAGAAIGSQAAWLETRAKLFELADAPGGALLAIAAAGGQLVRPSAPGSVGVRRAHPEPRHRPRMVHLPGVRRPDRLRDELLQAALAAARTAQTSAPEMVTLTADPSLTQPDTRVMTGRPLAIDTALMDLDRFREATARAQEAAGGTGPRAGGLFGQGGEAA